MAIRHTLNIADYQFAGGRGHLGHRPLARPRARPDDPGLPPRRPHPQRTGLGAGGNTWRSARSLQAAGQAPRLLGGPVIMPGCPREPPPSARGKKPASAPTRHNHGLHIMCHYDDIRIKHALALPYDAPDRVFAIAGAAVELPDPAVLVVVGPVALAGHGTRAPRGRSDVGAQYAAIMTQGGPGPPSTASGGAGPLTSTKRPPIWPCSGRSRTSHAWQRAAKTGRTCRPGKAWSFRFK